jgi:folylpolyglutamate synthase/dihydropteroate synthase
VRSNFERYFAPSLAARIASARANVPVRAEPNPIVAVEEAIAAGQTVCVTGSIYLVGAVRDRLRRRAILR